MQDNLYLYRALRPQGFYINLSKRRHWFADDDAATPADPPETPPAQTGDTGQPEATFTQADVDRMMGERARRASEAATKKLLEDLGIADVDTLRKELEAKRKRDEAELSELERRDKRIAELEAQAVREKEAREAAERTALDTRRDSAIITALVGAEKPQSVLTLLRTEHTDLVSKVLKDDGTVDDSAVVKVVEAAKKDYAGMFKAATPGTGSHNGGRQTTPDPDKLLDQLFKGKRTKL